MVAHACVYYIDSIYLVYAQQISQFIYVVLFVGQRITQYFCFLKCMLDSD